MMRTSSQSRAAGFSLTECKQLCLCRIFLAAQADERLVITSVSFGKSANY